MKKKSKLYKFFISYSWVENSKNIADQVYSDLNSTLFKSKIELIKDDQTLRYKSSIENFMENIRKVDFAILLIGKDYLESFNCMKEVLHLRKDIDQEKKMLPILIGDANIFSAKGRLEYVKFWKNKKEQLQQIIDDIGDFTKCIPSIEELKTINEIELFMDDFLQDVSRLLIPPYKELKNGNYIQLFQYCNIDVDSIESSIFTPIFIDKELHLLDQMYDAISLYYKSFSYIPIRHLKLYYPFNINGNVYDYPFGIHIDNENLIKLWKNIHLLRKGEDNKDIKDIKKVPNYESKIKTIIGSLVRNLIYSISEGRDNVSIRELYEQKKDKCNCIYCSYNKLDFKQLFLELNNQLELDLKESIKKAYLHYKIGNFETAASLFKKCLTKAEEEKEYIYKFICKRNILILESFIHLRTKVNNEILYEIYREQKGCLPTSAELATSGFSVAFINWINSNTFFTEAYYTISSLVDAINKDHSRFLNGGYSYNNNAAKLISTYYDLHSFLEENFIIYDCYLEYKSFFQKYLEGYFLCLSLPSSQTITSINNDFITQIIHQANPDDLIEYAKKYKIQNIKYENDERDSLFNLFRNYCDSIKHIDKSKIDESNYTFSSYLDKIINNYLILFNLLDLDKNTLNNIASQLCSLFDNIEIKTLTFKHLFSFCLNNIELISNDRSIILIKAIFNNKEFETVYNTYYLGKILEMKKIPIESIIEFNILFSRIKLSEGQHMHSYQLRIFMPILQMFKDEKEYLNSYLINYISNVNHDIELYYSACIYDMIDYKLFWDTFIQESIKSIKKKPEAVSFFENENAFNPNSYFRIIVDLCIRYEIDTLDEKFNELRDISDFYRWMLDLENYDYSNFKVEWLKIYTTHVFLKRYSEIKPIKECLKQYLKEHEDNLLSSIYLDYF